jgi:hypothetical protein
VLLFQKRFHAGLVGGSVTATFRLWDKPHVKPGGRYRVHPIGVVEVDAVERVTVAGISEADARAAGFDSRDALIDYMRPVAKTALTDATPVFRVVLHHGGQDDRVPIALDANLSDDEVKALRARLRRFDAKKPWTIKTLKLIAANPRTAASKLAKKHKRETLPFKVDVRKLKKLGLTMSFEVGYELSPRGKALMARLSGKR